VNVARIVKCSKQHLSCTGFLRLARANFVCRKLYSGRGEKRNTL